MYHLLFLLMLSRVGATSALFDSATKQTGDGTYFALPDYGKGNCALRNVESLPAFSRADIAVAINHPQYANSGACGMCVRYHGSAAGGLGSDPISTEWKTAIVVDRCPECKKGDLDFGAKKDGRWGIEWYAIPCPVGISKVQYAFEGSNKWYLKLQVRNTLVPVKEVAICQGTQCKALTRTVDNHFLTQGAGFSKPFPDDLKLRLTSLTDEVVMDTIRVPNPDEATHARPIAGTVQFTKAPGSIREKHGSSTTDTTAGGANTGSASTDGGANTKSGSTGSSGSSGGGANTGSGTKTGSGTNTESGSNKGSSTNSGNGSGSGANTGSASTGGGANTKSGSTGSSGDGANTGSDTMTGSVTNTEHGSNIDSSTNSGNGNCSPVATIFFAMIVLLS